VPAIFGEPVFLGPAPAAVTMLVGPDTAELEPTLFVAVTKTRRRVPDVGGGDFVRLTLGSVLAIVAVRVKCCHW
jgi:hypothetical protein